MPRKKPPAQPKERTLGRHFFKEWRKYRGYTQEQAAEMLGMDRSNLSKIESFQVPYDQELLERAATAYRCELADLVMRNPLDEEAPWSLWETLEPEQRRQVIRIIKAIKDDKAA